jgi:hypothetical protein
MADEGMDLGRLGIVIDGTGARREVRFTSEELAALANQSVKTEAATKGLGKSMGGPEGPGGPPDLPPRINRVTAAIERMRRASAVSKGLDLGLSQQIAMLDPFQERVTRANATLSRTGTVAHGARLGLGRLGNQFSGLASAVAGVHPVVGNILGVMGNFAIGSPWTVGILAGVAAIAVVYDQLTKSAREAAKANDDLRTSLAERMRRESMGPEPDLQLQLNAERNAQRQNQERRRQLLKFGVKPDDQRILDLSRQIENSQTLLIQGEKALFKARMEAGTPLKTIEVEGKNITRENEKVLAAQEKYNAAIQRAKDWITEQSIAQAKATLSVEQGKVEALKLRDAALQGSEAFKKAQDEIEIMNELQRIGVNIFDARYAAMKRDLEITQRLRNETEATVDAQKKANDDAIAAEKKIAEDRARYIENLVRSMQENISQFFRDTMSDGLKSFDKLWQNVKALYFKMIADILAAKAMEKIGGILGITTTPAAAMDRAAVKQVAAGGTMLTASAAMIAAANVMAAAAGVPGVAGAQAPAPPSGGGASGSPAFGIGWQRAGGAAIGGGLAGYATGSALYDRALSDRQNRLRGGFGGAATGAAAGFAVGGPIGAAVGAITGFVAGVFGAGSAAKKAAKEMAALQQALKLTMDTYRAGIRGDTLGEALAQSMARLKDLLLQINDAYRGRKNEGERERLRQEAMALQAEEARQINEQHAQDRRYAQEDLQVRLLSAQGHTAEAEALAFAQQQERELAAARLAGADAAYLATLSQVQAAEKLKAASDAAASSMLNMVSGYKLQATVFGEMNPRSSVARFPGAPPTPTPLPWRHPAASPGGDLTVNVVADGQVIGKAVLKDFKSKAQKKFGDSSRWPEIQS